MSKPIISKVRPGMPWNLTAARSGRMRSLSEARAEEENRGKSIAPPSAPNK